MADDGHSRMGDHRESRRLRRQRRRRGAEPVEDPALSFEERTYRNARSLAERKTALAGQALRIGLITLALLVWVPVLGVICLIIGGIPLISKFYRLVLEPEIRDKFINREVQRQVDTTLSRERHALVDQQARSMEELSASIAHEIRNPITAAKSLVQQMGEEPRAAENVEYARVALEELHRVERSVSHLLRFARDEAMQVEELRLSEIVDSALETFKDRLARAGTRLIQQLDTEGAMRGDAEQLRRIVINLVGNAIDALEESGTAKPELALQMGENLAGTEVWLRIVDNGPGIDEQALAKLFSPFYTSKPNGTGLGLAITKKLVDAHGGNIEVKSSPGRGADFLLTFPKRPAADATPSSEGGTS
jgi:signal transduction histidine kinase